MHREIYIQDYIESMLELKRKILEQEPCEDMREVSDGYHTFNQLYNQRVILDKIIADIEEYKSRQSFGIGEEDLERGKQIALEYVLAMLGTMFDKYKVDKVESEDKE